MERSLEALRVIADRRPSCVCLRTDITAEDEVHIGTTLDVRIHNGMPLQCATCSRCCQQTQVIKVFQQVKLTLRRITDAVAVVDIDLRITDSTRMIHIHMMFLIVHHGIKFMVVGYTDGHGVRIDLGQIVSRIEGHPCLFVLIPIDGRVTIVEGRTIDMLLSLIIVGEDLPAVTKRLIESRIHLRCCQADSIARQYGGRRTQFTDSGHSTLQLQMDVHHMELISLLDTAIVFILIVGILIDHGDDLLLGHIVDIALAADIERCEPYRLLTLDDEVFLIVSQAFVNNLSENRSFMIVITIGIILIAVILRTSIVKCHGFHLNIII